MKNITNTLYDYYEAINSINSLIKSDRIDDALYELTKLQDSIFFDYVIELKDDITVGEDGDDKLPDFPDDIDESNYNPYMGCDEYDYESDIDINSWGEY